MKRRVVITGMGAITPLGLDVGTTWKGLIEGRSGVDYITRFNTDGFKCKIAGEVKGFKPENFISPKEIIRTDLFTQFALASTKMAMADSGLQIDETNEDRVGVIIGTGLGGLETLEKNYEILSQRGNRKVSPFLIPSMIPNMASGYVAILTGAKGLNMCISTACASGTHSVGEAFKAIRDGYADYMITGGTEATITPLALSGFENIKALAKNITDPKKASCPFDKKREGFVMAEGAGIVILEELESAKKRKATIYCEIIGYAANDDAFNPTAPSPEGIGAVKCMRFALNDAGIDLEAIEYINAHGTSTIFNDENETKAIKTVFKEHAYRLMVSSTKSMIGHSLGASGGMETIFTALSLLTGIIPPTINYETPDPECDLDYVPNVAREKVIDCALSNSFGFGGHNACLILKRFTG